MKKKSNLKFSVRNICAYDDKEITSYGIGWDDR